MQESHIPDNQ